MQVAKAAAEVQARLVESEQKIREAQDRIFQAQAAEAQLQANMRLAEVEANEAKELLARELKAAQDQLLSELAVEEHRRRHELQVELLQIEQDRIREREALEKELEKHREMIQEEMRQLEEERQAKLRVIASEEKERLATLEEELKKKASEWEQEKEETEQELADAYIAQRDKLVAELEDIKAELEQQAKVDFERWLVPHIQEMDSKLKEIEALKGTISMLRDQLAETRDIKLSGQDGTEEGDRANAVLIWLKARGQYCDYCSAAFDVEGNFVLNFMPWVASPKTERAIKGLLTWMIPQFGLSQIPVLQPNGYARAWTLVLTSARNRAERREPEMTVSRLSDYFVRDRAGGEVSVGGSFEDLEPQIREGVARELNYQMLVNEMMVFRPSLPLPKPNSYQITELEIMTCKWLYFWRSLSTDGKEPNITSRKGLLFYVYGIREGRGSSTYDPIICESLGQRINRILEILRTEAVELSDQEEKS